MKEFLKILLIRATRLFTRLLFIFPIKNNRYVFISFGGRSFTCCPKYIYNELQSQFGKENEYIWILRDPTSIDIPGENVKKVKFLSFSFFFYMATAKYIFSNYSMITRPPLRKKQIYVNTWHGGGAYKKVGLTNNVKERKRTDMTFDILAKDTTWFISSSKIFTQVMSESMRMPPSQFLEIGMPRNDIFFSDNSSIRNKICDYYKIPENTKILLYAPTYRGEAGNFSENVQLDIEKTVYALEKRFNSQFICIYRGHYYIHDKTLENTINASDYPDMQELLCAADVLITDYSSSMWDFSLTGKPCFLFTPDLNDYSESREFYTPIEKWGFEYGTTNEEFCDRILNFDSEKYKHDVEKNHEFFGSFETGKASKEILKILNITIAKTGA